MIEIKEMPDREIEEVLELVGYGHLGCALDNKPYVVPINYAYDKPDIYIYTTEGKKSEIIKANPQVCLQIEQVVDNGDWRSIIITGEAEQVTDKEERERAVKCIMSVNPTLTPAISIRWANDWIRENIEIIYRINPTEYTGRSTFKVKTKAAFVQPGGAQRTQLY